MRPRSGVRVPSLTLTVACLRSRGGGGLQWAALAFGDEAMKRAGPAPSRPLPPAIVAAAASISDLPPSSVPRLVSASVRLAWAAGRRELMAIAATLVVSVGAVAVGLLFTRSLLSGLLHADRAGQD